MMKGFNGLSPLAALIVTLLAAVCCVWLFVGRHVFWGVVLALITADFAADLVLSLKKPDPAQK